MSTVQRKRRLTILDKMCVIKRLVSGQSNIRVSQHYNLPHSIVSNIFKHRVQITQTFSHQNYISRKIEYALLEWLKNNRERHVSVTVPLLRAKAYEFAKSFGIPNFKCTNSWLRLFKRHHSNKFVWSVTVNDNTLEVVSQNVAASDWLKTKWPSLRKGYTDKQIYNASETGVFYKLMPDKSFRFQEYECTNGELPEERLTILITVNMTGTDKKKLLVIGKHNNPRSFNGINYLPVQYENNQKSWMTSSIFRKFLHQWDKELFLTSKKALLLIDDCPVHLSLSNLTSINVVYLPFKSLIPMNQGIIKSFKFHFKKNLILHHVKQIENIQVTKVDMFQAICMLESAWDQVSFGVISNCFKCFDSLSIEQAEESNKKENLVSWAKNLLVFDTEILQQFENVDSELVTSNQVWTQFGNQYNNVEETDEDEEIDMIKDKITLNQAYDVLEKLKKFLATDEYFLKSYNHTKQLQIILDNSLYKQKYHKLKLVAITKS